MRVKLAQSAGGLALEIPEPLVRAAQLQDGETVDLREEAGRLVLQPLTAVDLDALIDGITDENRHGEIDFGPAVGREVW